MHFFPNMQDTIHIEMQDDDRRRRRSNRRYGPTEYLRKERLLDTIQKTLYKKQRQNTLKKNTVLRFIHMYWNLYHNCPLMFISVLLEMGFKDEWMMEFIKAMKFKQSQIPTSPILSYMRTYKRHKLVMLLLENGWTMTLEHKFSLIKSCIFNYELELFTYLIKDGVDPHKSPVENECSPTHLLNQCYAREKDHVNGHNGRCSPSRWSECLNELEILGKMKKVVEDNDIPIPDIKKAE